MNNLIQCSCEQNEKLKKRDHHGIVCTTCNPNIVEPLLVPDYINAYRVWNYSHDFGFINTPSYTIRNDWSNFNDDLPPDATEALELMKPWNVPAKCRIYNHKSPSPYCSCGFYSLKKFGVTGYQFQHDSSRQIMRNFQPIGGIIRRFNQKDLNKYFELMFYSPLAKLLFVDDINLVADVKLSGRIIECEKGYRSEHVLPKKFYLLLDLKELVNIVMSFSRHLDVTNRDCITATYHWLLLIEEYFTNLLSLYECKFELKIKHSDFLPMNENMKNTRMNVDTPYTYYKNHPYFDGIFNTNLSALEFGEATRNIRLLNISDLVLKDPIYGTSNVRYINNHRLNKVGQPLWDKYSKRDLSPRYLFDRIDAGRNNDILLAYTQRLLSFGQLSATLTNTYGDQGSLLHFPDFSPLFGFTYHSYLENKINTKELLKENYLAEHHPSFWFPSIYGFYKKFNKEEEKTRKENE